MKEQLSAFVDGELTGDAVSKLLNATKHNEELHAKWSTYHLIGDAMRDNLTLSTDFEQKVMAAIQAEPTVLAPKQAQSTIHQQQLTTETKHSWFLSAAASLAAVFFVGWIVLKGQIPAQTNELSPSVSIAQVSPVTSANTTANQATVEAAQIPAEYLLAHQSYAPSATSSYIQNASFSESAD